MSHNRSNDRHGSRRSDTRGGQSRSNYARPTNKNDNYRKRSNQRGGQLNRRHSGEPRKSNAGRHSSGSTSGHGARGLKGSGSSTFTRKSGPPPSKKAPANTSEPIEFRPKEVLAAFHFVSNLDVKVQALRKDIAVVAGNTKRIQSHNGHVEHQQLIKMIVEANDLRKKLHLIVVHGASGENPGEETEAIQTANTELDAFFEAVATVKPPVPKPAPEQSAVQSAAPAQRSRSRSTSAAPTKATERPATTLASAQPTSQSTSLRATATEFTPRGGPPRGPRQPALQPGPQPVPQAAQTHFRQPMQYMSARGAPATQRRYER